MERNIETLTFNCNGHEIKVEQERARLYVDEEKTNLLSLIFIGDKYYIDGDLVLVNANSLANPYEIGEYLKNRLLELEKEKQNVGN